MWLWAGSQPSWNLAFELTCTQPINLILPHNRILRIMSLFRSDSETGTGFAYEYSF